MPAPYICGFAPLLTLSFTSIPNNLKGPSYRQGWVYHEMPIVQKLLDRYSNIQHFMYLSPANLNIFQILQEYYPFVDQPCRNVSNMSWVLASHTYAREQGGRVLLTGSRGNSTVSWSSYSWKRWLLHWKQSMSTLIKPQGIYNNYYQYHSKSFLRSSQAKQILRQNTVSFWPHFSQLSSLKNALSKSTYYPISLRNGVVSLDPTIDLDVVEFCYNAPDWIYRDGHGVLNNRLLIRRGLSYILPDEITNNLSRGEQAADWFFHYNEHAALWHDQVQSLSEDTKIILHRYYDEQEYRNLQKNVHLPLKGNDSQTRSMLDLSLMRYMSSAFFLNYLNSF